MSEREIPLVASKYAVKWSYTLFQKKKCRHAGFRFHSYGWSLETGLPIAIPLDMFHKNLVGSVNERTKDTPYLLFFQQITKIEGASFFSMLNPTVRKKLEFIFKEDNHVKN